MHACRCVFFPTCSFLYVRIRFYLHNRDYRRTIPKMTLFTGEAVPKWELRKHSWLGKRPWSIPTLATIIKYYIIDQHSALVIESLQLRAIPCNPMQCTRPLLGSLPLFSHDFPVVQYHTGWWVDSTRCPPGCQVTASSQASWLSQSAPVPPHKHLGRGVCPGSGRGYLWIPSGWFMSVPPSKAPKLGRDSCEQDTFLRFPVEDWFDPYLFGMFEEMFHLIKAKNLKIHLCLGLLGTSIQSSCCQNIAAWNLDEYICV